MENSDLIRRAICYAKENFTNTDISVENIAEYAGFSMDYFNRIFLAHTGFTVMSYVNYMRVRKAVTLLRSTSKSILDIALDVGYDSHEGFIKAFKKVYSVTPNEYRKQNSDKVLSWGELSDSSCLNRFLHENKNFQQIDPDLLIDYLLEIDSKRFAYFCTMIKNMGLFTVAPSGDYEKGIIGICDDGNGGFHLHMISDDLGLIADWTKQFDSKTTFYSTETPRFVEETMKDHGLIYKLNATPHSLYLGHRMKCDLPPDNVIRELTCSDKDHVLKWANGKMDGYIRHLLNEKHYMDPSVLEYGVFQNDELIAVAGCGIEEVRGIRFNDCCNIRFGKEITSAKLYYDIFAFVINDILNRGILPFDNLQNGEFAKTHGAFEASDVGFTIVNWQYDVL